MNRKISIFLIVFSVFISIGAVSAENVTDDSAIDMLSTADDASFTALNATINSGNDVIEITMDYAFDYKSDANFAYGIIIDNEDIVINGNNHTIDGKNLVRIFQITNTSNIVINNLILKNADGCAIVNYGELKTNNVEFNGCSATNGAAVYLYGAKYRGENDRFIENSAQLGAAICAVDSVVDIDGGYFYCNNVYDGVIFSQYSKMTIINASFISNFGKNGAAIKSLQSNMLLNNSLFEGNSADSGSVIVVGSGNVTFINSLVKNNRNNWSAIYSENANVNVLNTTFANSTSRYATAIYNKNGVTSIKKSRFIDLSAEVTAGALAFKGSNNVTIESSEFINVMSAKNGGAVFLDILGPLGDGEGNILINNTIFENCLSGFGGAYLQLGGTLLICNSNFTKNSAEYHGGAIYLSNTKTIITDSRFAENSVLTHENYPTYGGAIFSDNSYFDAYYSNFTKNSAVEGSALYMFDTTYDLDNLEFNGNGNAVHAVFDEGSIRNIKGSDEISADDFNNTEYYDYVEGAGMQMVLLNNTVNVTSIPSRYDLREENLVTPVKNQGYMGACWTFGTTAALESALLKAMNYTADFSENNMQDSMLYYSRFGSTDIFEGGSIRNSLGYLLSWLGAFPNDYDAYDEMGKISPLIMTEEDIHVQDVIVIPNVPGNNETMNNVKKAILQYGGLVGALFSKATADDGNLSEYYNANTSAQYVPIHLETNHVVCVVGWDDSYSAGNFIITPPGDGAWIVKNSWGTDWGDKGYFYVSYYDQSLCASPDDLAECFVAFVIENDIPYNKNYQYDFTGLTGGFHKENWTEITYFNSFESYGDDLIAAVGTYFESEGIEYKIEVEVNDESVYNQTGVSPYYGYHTIKLDKYVPIKNGDNFVVAVTSNAVPFCANSRTHFKAKTSMAAYPDGEMKDLGESNMAASLKVYTIEDSRHNTTLITPNRVIYVNDCVNGYDYQFILKDANGTALADREVSVSFNDKTQTVTTDENGWGTVTLKANEEGIYDVEVTFEGDNDYAGISQMAAVKLVREKTNFVAPNRTVYVQQMSRGYTYSAILKDTGGKAIANRKILFIFGGEKQVAYTDENGWATVKLTAVNAGTQTVTIRFAGDRYYHQTETTRIIKIVRESTKMTVADKTFVSSDVPKKVTAILKSKSDNPVYGAKITLTVDGRTYSATTDNNGVAVFNIGLTKLGIFTATARFADSRFFAATATSSKIYII